MSKPHTFLLLLLINAHVLFSLLFSTVMTVPFDSSSSCEIVCCFYRWMIAMLMQGTGSKIVGSGVSFSGINYTGFCY